MLTGPHEHPDHRSQPRHRRGRLRPAQIGRPQCRRPFDPRQRRADRRRPRRPGGAARHVGHRARPSSTARSTCWSTMPASTKRSPTMRRTTNGTPPGQRTLTINLQAAADLAALAVSHFLDARHGGPDRQRRQPRRLSRRFARSTGIMRRPRARWSRMTRTIARGYAAEGILCFAVAPGFTVSEMTEEYLAGRGGAQIVADIPLGRVATHRRSRRNDPLAGDRRARLGDRQRDRRQRRELCSLAWPSSPPPRSSTRSSSRSASRRARSSGRSLR